MTQLPPDHGPALPGLKNLGILRGIDPCPTTLGTRLHQRILEVSGGAELTPTARTKPRGAPTFGDDETSISSVT